MTAPLVFLDTETTGVHRGRRAWEIAMIRRDGDVDREICFMVDVDLADADPFGLKIGGFYERHPHGRFLSGLTNDSINVQRSRVLDGRPSPDEAQTESWAALTVAAWTNGAHIVGAVPNFDTEVLATLLREYALTPAWHYHLIDVEALAYGYLQGMGFEGDEPLPLPWSSENLTRAIDVELSTPEDRHTALGDARWARRIWDKVNDAPDRAPS